MDITGFGPRHKLRLPKELGDNNRYMPKDYKKLALNNSKYISSVRCYTPAGVECAHMSISDKRVFTATLSYTDPCNTKRLLRFVNDSLLKTDIEHFLKFATGESRKFKIDVIEYKSKKPFELAFYDHDMRYFTIEHKDPNDHNSPDGHCWFNRIVADKFFQPGIELVDSDHPNIKLFKIPKSIKKLVFWYMLKGKTEYSSRDCMTISFHKHHYEVLNVHGDKIGVGAYNTNKSSCWHHVIDIKTIISPFDHYRKCCVLTLNAKKYDWDHPRLVIFEIPNLYYKLKEIKKDPFNLLTIHGKKYLSDQCHWEEQSVHALFREKAEISQFYGIRAVYHDSERKSDGKKKK